MRRTWKGESKRVGVPKELWPVFRAHGVSVTERKNMPRSADITKQKITDFVGEQLVLTNFLDSGRDGIVFAGHFKKGHQLDVAVKFYVSMESGSLFDEPSRLPSFVIDLKDRYEHELAHLKSIRHPNLQQYVACGLFAYDRHYFRKYNARVKIGEEIPFIVSRLVRGKRLDILLSDSASVSRRALLSFLRGLANGLAHLHRQNILHNDIRAPNVVVESDTDMAVLVDFGLSKDLSVGRTNNTRLFLDPNRVPREIRAALEEMQVTPGSWNPRQLREVLFPHIDLYQFALLIQSLLESDGSKTLDSFDREFLELVCAPLLSWKLATRQGPPKAELVGPIETAAQLLDKLERLCEGPDYFRRRLADSECRTSRTIVRRVGSVNLRDSIAPFLSHPGLRRLHNLNQLSLIHYIYPSAGQSRFDHSLSALARAQQIWDALSTRPAFLFHMDFKDIDKLELAALHHDVNHFPFLHYFQEAAIPSIDRAMILDTFLAVPGVAKGREGAPSLGQELEVHGLDAAYFRMLISPDLPLERSPADQIIKSIVNSGVDVDKLAYLPDDAAFSGVPFGNGIDFHGLLAGIDLALVDPPAEEQRKPFWHVVFSQDALPAVESVCFARYWNFRRLYWHHTNRAIAAMIIWTVRRLYSNGSESPEAYFKAVMNLGEAGALEYLAKQHLTVFEHAASIQGLSTNRDLVYKRIFEVSFQEFGDMLTQPAQRESAEDRVHECVDEFVRSHGSNGSVRRGEVLLDIPLRRIDLGGRIFIRGLDGQINPATEASPVLKQLQQNFDTMSKVLRVFVSPGVRNRVAGDRWETSHFRSEIARAVRGQEKKSEVV